MKKFLKICLFVGLGLILMQVLFLLILVNEDKNQEKASLKVKDLIEQGDYVAAKKVAQSGSYNDIKLVTNAQVNDLISQGRFDIAAEVAKEDGLYITYFDGIINHLSQIYIEHGGNKLLYAMSLVVYPDTKDKYLPDYWGRIWSLDEDSRQIVARSNKNIESFCDYLKLSGEDKSFIPKMLSYLKPIYRPAETKWNVQEQKDIVLKEAYIDYSDVKRIKAKYGY